MSATFQDIQGWLVKAIKHKATHLIVAVDRYDYDNYPVYVTSDKDVHEEYDRIIGSSMQEVDEVYNMSMDIDKQLSEHRALNF